ncbi:MAG: hypothetical protein WBX25_31535 [Rhodomicrobium sp.]
MYPLHSHPWSRWLSQAQSATLDAIEDCPKLFHLPEARRSTEFGPMLLGEGQRIHRLQRGHLSRRTGKPKGKAKTAREIVDFICAYPESAAAIAM